MPKEDNYEVEKIVDKRITQQGEVLLYSTVNDKFNRINKLNIHFVGSILYEMERLFR